jgi:hypothetical protein
MSAIDLAKARPPMHHARHPCTEAERSPMPLVDPVIERVLADFERRAEEDEAALLLAAVLASTHLGPIMDIDARDLFGVKTARIRLARGGLSLCL